MSAARKDYDSAVKYYQKAIDGVPMPEFLIGLCSVYRKMGKTAEAQLDLLSNIKRVYEANGGRHGRRDSTDDGESRNRVVKLRYYVC